MLINQEIRRWKRKCSLWICQNALCQTILWTFFITRMEGALSPQNPKVTRHDPQGLVGITIQENRGPPIFYDTFFPVIFEIKGPSWNVTNLKLEIPKNITFVYGGPANENNDLCKAAATASPSSSMSLLPNNTNLDIWENTICPIKRKLDQLLERFATELKIFDTANASLTKMDAHFSSCQEIRPHFSNHIIDELEIQLYLVQIIMDCPFAEAIHKKIKVSSPDKGKYAELFQLFLETYITPRFRLIGFPKFAIPTNTLMTLHTTHLLSYLLDNIQWTTSINICNSQRIPPLLIPQKTLVAALKDVQNKIAKEDLALTIPLLDLSNYYKFKLADCVLTTSNTYIVRVLVPLTKVTPKYKLVTVRPIPFLNKDTASKKMMICQHKNAEGNYIVEGATMKPIGTTTCSEGELCRVPPDGERSLYSRCIHATLKNDVEKMLEYCKMSCVSVDPINLPFIKRIRSDQFVIAGPSSAEIAVICKKKESTVIDNIPEDMGSVIVTIPCGCYMTHRSVHYEVNGICEFTVDIRPVHPKGFTYDSFLQHYFHHHLETFSHAIVNNVINQSRADLFANDYDDNNGNSTADLLEDSDSDYPTWSIYLAYIFLFLGTIIFVGGCYVLRNAYIRIGQLEMGIALANTRTSRNLLEPAYSRNIPVTFNVRSVSGAHSSDVIRY